MTSSTPATDVRVSRRAALGAAAAASVTLPTAARAAAAKRPSRLPDAASVPSGRDPADLSVLEAAALLQARQLSPVDLLAAVTRRIEARNGPVTFDGAPDAINAFVRRYPDLAATQAKRAEQRLSKAGVRRAGRRAPLLCGVPLVLKDLYAVDGKPLTASSRVLAGNVASGDSTAWARLARAGMVLLGHAHTDEFAFFYRTPQTGNPWDRAKVAGGSSGGSAAALAARMAPAALGSDTLGSLRIPASFCGVSSIKPTFGLVSAAGVLPYVWSLDHCGPMARRAGDLGLLLDALAGADVDDPSTAGAQRPADRYPTLPAGGGAPLEGVRIGVTSLDGCADGIKAVHERCRRELAGLGATLVEVTPPPDPFDLDDQLALLTDALVYHRPWFLDRPQAYGEVCQQFLTLLAARNATALDYLELHRRRASLMTRWAAFFARERLDAVAEVVCEVEVPARDHGRRHDVATDPVISRLRTYVHDYAGLPSVTTPGGTSPASGMPVGVQLVGAVHTEATLLRIAIEHQAAHPYADETPKGLA